MSDTLSPVKKNKKIPSLFFGMKITKNQQQKIDALAQHFNVSRSKAVMSLIENTKLENIPVQVPCLNALELSKLPKKQRMRIMKMQAESGLSHFEIIEDDQQILEF